MKRFVTLAAIVAGAFVSAEASAQVQDSTWLNDRRYREGIGWRVGDLELHPGIGADFGYDSNFLRRSGDANEPTVGSLRLKVSPHLSVSTLGARRRGPDAPPPSLNWRLELQGTYNEFFPVSGPQAAQDTLQDQRNIGVTAATSLDIMPGREWSGGIKASFARTVRPTNEGDPTATLNRLTPRAGVNLIWAPGSGLLDWSLGYDFTGTFFESSAFGGLDNIQNEILTRGRWRFLPRTALIFDGRFGFVTYLDPNSAINRKTDSHPMRARIGVNGLITNNIGVLAMVGWGASFYTAQVRAGTNENLTQDFDSVIAQAEVKWYIDPPEVSDPMKLRPDISSLAVGFTRDFEDSFIGTYIERDFGYAKFNYLFGGVFLLAAEAQAGAVVFPQQTVVDFGNPAGWTDVRVDATLLGEYRFTDWLGVNLDVGYTGYFSDTVLSDTDANGTPFTNALKYQIFKVFGGVRVFL